ncbi:hypothetical protein IT157_02335, partial [bacterium]|nr:hypothetical protein [bacterium]
AEYLFNQNVPDFAIEPAISIPVASSASSLELSAVLDASTQPTGMNRVWLRMQNSQGVWSQPVAQRVFINAGGAASDHHLAGGEVYFDSDPGLGNGLALSSDDGLFEELIEDLNNTYGVGSLSQGTHTAYSRVQDSRGVWSVTRHGDFNVTAPEFFEATILNPNGGEGLWVGDTADIQWTTDIPAGTIKLEINRNFPSPNWALLGENLANTGHFPWVVTGPANNVRIRLTTSYFSATDTTDTDFVIRQGQVAVASPNGGEIWRVDEQRLIQWAPEFLGGHVALEFNPDYPNSNWIVIDTVRTQDSSFAWNVPDYPSEHLRLRVTSTLDPVATDMSDADFIIPIASITVVTPNGLEQTQIGDSLTVSWTSENLAAATVVSLNRDYPAGDWEQLATGQPSIGTYKWRAGYPPTTVARIRVSAPTVAGVTDESDAEFTLLPAPPELLPGLPSNPFPPDGEINVVRQPLLSWSPATQTDSYDLYFWDADSVRPATPMVLNLTTTSYQIPAPLYYGERYKWQVVAKNYFGRMESPEWDFTIYSLPDLQVASVTVPPTAFSGQTVQISWITTNTGLGSTNAPLWYDRVYLSALPDFVEQATTMYGAYQNPMFLAPSESYSNNATITLPQGIAGPYYIFVKCDREEQLVEASDSNNVGRCAAAMQVTLTPPADLRVSSIGAASIAYSGTQFNVSWTVQNHGTGETNASSWVDYVILSLDTVADYGERVIGAAMRSGSLDADSSYTLNAQVDIPNGVWGNYYLLVSTDAQGHVYEYVYEQNNLKHIPIEIILSPTADLVPTSLGCADSGFTGESFDVSWTIENQGLGSTFVNRWGDNLYLSADTVFSFEQDILFGGATHLYSLLPSGSNYSVQGTFTLPNGLPTGEYYLFVYTDTGNEVLEWAADWNNAFRRLQPIHITLSQGPNLVVTNVSVPSQVTGGQSYTLTYTVTNIGPGDIPSNAT